MLDHPGHLFRRDRAASNDQVSLVLSALIVHDDQELARLECCQRIVHRVKRELGSYRRVLYQRRTPRLSLGIYGGGGHCLGAVSCNWRHSK